MTEGGFNNIIIDANPDLAGFDRFQEIHTIQTMNSTPDFSRVPSSPPQVLYSTAYDWLPANLELKAYDASLSEAITIQLTPANPSNSHRLEFVKRISELVPSFTTLSRFLWIWAQSWGINQLNPFACACMVMHYLLVSTRTLPSIMSSCSC